MSAPTFFKAACTEAAKRVVSAIFTISCACFRFPVEIVAITMDPATSLRRIASMGAVLPITLTATSACSTPNSFDNTAMNDCWSELVKLSADSKPSANTMKT
jgi:hypothetical protein